MSQAAECGKETDLRFVETIKVQSGRAQALPYHQARMERTIRHFFPSLASDAMPSLERLLVPTPEMALFKARVVYGAQGVEAVEYAPYVMRTIRSLQVVEDDAIDYTFKRCDRTSLSALVARRVSVTRSSSSRTDSSPIPPTPTSPSSMATNGSRPANPCWLAPGVPRS